MKRVAACEEHKDAKIKAVIWDNGGVIAAMADKSFDLLWAERLGVPRDDVIRVLTSPESDLLDMGEISKDTYFNYVITNIGLPAHMKSVLDLTIDDFRCDWELLAYIQAMKEQMITALLSVMPLYVQEILRTHWPDLEKAFDHIIISSEVHLIKPDPKIYELTLARIGCRAEETVFIDDAEVNVDAARKLGMHAVLFKDRAQAIAELESILIS